MRRTPRTALVAPVLLAGGLGRRLGEVPAPEGPGS